MGRYTGERVLSGPVQVRPASIKVAVSWLIAGWLIRRTVRLVVWLIRHPSALAAAGLLVGLGWLYATYGPVPLLTVVSSATAVMRDRQARLRGVTRLHTPTPDDPYIVILVDELASLSAYVTDRDAKARIKAALSLLLSQGRAVGITVVAALQDPRKAVLPFRDLFPTRLALRLTERDQVDMVQGEGARARGARCDKIPESLPGVGYVTLDGIAEPLRVRFSWITDTHIQHMVDTYTPSLGLRPVEGGEAA